MSSGAVGEHTHEGALDAYAALAAHQLGEAVTLLRGYTAQLQADADALTPHAREAVRGIAAGAERTQRFVDDLLDLKLAASAPVGLDVVALDDVVAQAQTVLAAQLEAPGIEVSWRPLPRVCGNADLLERMFVHLLRAALAARTGARLRIEIAGDDDGQHVTLEVRDDGAPLASVVVAQVFEPFARARGRGPLVGAGVSLVVCRRIIERHGGAIDVRGRDGEGAVVTVTLPSAEG